MAPGAKEIQERGYWLFQSNPRGGDDLRFYLKGKRRVWWRATHFRRPAERMHEGDGVVLWQARGNQPDAAGVYAIGQLTGKFRLRNGGPWQTQVELDRVKLGDPIAPERIKKRKPLAKLAVLRRSGAEGSNFVLDRAQWYAFLSLWGESGGKEVPLAPGGSRETPKPPTPTVVPGRDSYLVEWPEASLVDRYVIHMGHKGITLRPRTMANRLRCDLFDDVHENLIEAKAHATRESIRMAIGELADYKRFIKPKHVSVLLPQRPQRDLENLLSAEGIHAIWSEGKSFTDNARRRFS